MIYTVFGVFSCSDDVLSPTTVEMCTFTNPAHYLRLWGEGVIL